MKLDPVLAEIQQIREAHSERFGGNLRAILDDLRRREQQSGRKLVSRVIDPPPPEAVEYQKRKLRESKADSAVTQAGVLPSESSEGPNSATPVHRGT